jgi:hypothetical protein
MDTQTVQWMWKLVRAQHRVQLMLNRLPVLMRNKEIQLSALLETGARRRLLAAANGAHGVVRA